ncbi:hypothetical protein BN946_scf184801.g40 [Trametes cinnabarina]|uniref:AB hydrolase-1 domain-containing protein n=1 Tax=Pycnoporus cinnabarinus TaxID=5643 RepID=A0A060S8Q4_PYCCI|nr:hypothetical protein BN946_scf184801.g40 [Trametes cinnabarina]
MFANLDKVPEETHPPASALGYVLPANVAALRPNPSASVDQLVADFAVAVSSYYPPYTMQDSMDPTPLSNSLPLHKASAKVDQKFLPTTVKMKPEVLQSLIHPPIMGEHQRLMWALDIDILKDNLHRALLDCRFNVGPEPSKKVWPNLRVHLIYCDMTFRTCAWGATVVWLEHQRADQEYRRHLELHKLERANHFVHWEEPERFTSFLAGIV